VVPLHPYTVISNPFAFPDLLEEIMFELQENPFRFVFPLVSGLFFPFFFGTREIPPAPPSLGRCALGDFLNIRPFSSDLESES